MMLVVGVDPGSRSASALHLAMMLARSTETRVVVAAVLPPTWSSAAGTVDAEWRRYTRDSANLALDHAAAVLGNAVEAEYVLYEARSARSGLVEIAMHREADFIVLGSAATGVHGRVMIGAEGDAVLHSSPIPVAIAPRGFRTAGEISVGQVTAAHRGTESASDIVLGAAEIAARLGAQLRLASFAVFPRGSGASGAGRDVERRIADEWANSLLEQSRSLLAEISDASAAPTLVGGMVGAGESWGAALDDLEWRVDEILVVGSSSGGQLAQVFLGSHASKIARNSRVPVVVLPR